MRYIVNLAQADVINMNNRCYSKECLEQIKNQIISNIDLFLITNNLTKTSEEIACF